MKFIRHIILFSGIVFSGIKLFAQGNYSWTQMAPNPGPGRHRACSCSINNRAYYGLGHNNSAGDTQYADWWEYDPGTDTWMQRADFGGGPRQDALCFAALGKAYIAAGYSSINNDDLWEYNPSTNAWQFISAIPGNDNFSTGVAFAINNKGYLVLSECIEFDPANNSWQVKTNPPYPQYSTPCVVMNNKAYMGICSSSPNSWYQYNPAIDAWSPRASFPGAYRFAPGAFMYHGWIYIVGGSDNSGNDFDEIYAYRPPQDQWVQLSDFPGQPRHFMKFAEVAGKVYGGGGTGGVNYTDWWRFGDIVADLPETNGENSVSVFPNPVEDEANFNFSHSTENNCEFSLYNTSGQLVRNEKTGSVLQWKFERNDLASGLYVYVFHSGTTEITHGNILLK